MRKLVKTWASGGTATAFQRLIVARGGTTFVGGTCQGADGSDWVAARYSAKGASVWRKRWDAGWSYENAVMDMTASDSTTFYLVGWANVPVDDVACMTARVQRQVCEVSPRSRA